jgi:putative ABC transport system ATP-binding protein
MMKRINRSGVKEPLLRSVPMRPRDPVFTLDKNFTFTHRRLTVLERIKTFFSPGDQPAWQLETKVMKDGEACDLVLRKGFIAVLGESGSGKSTLVSILGGHEKLSPEQKKRISFHTSGQLRSFAEKGFHKLSRERFGHIFQHCYESKPLNAIDNIALPLFIRKYSCSTIMRYCRRLMDFLNLKDLAKASANELSGGQLTRIGILRGIAQAPEVLFADEPANNLDQQNAGRILEILDTWRKNTNGTVIMVTHHVMHAFRYADQIIILKSHTQDNRTVSNVVYNQTKNGDNWTQSEKDDVFAHLSVANTIKKEIPPVPAPEKKHPGHYALFLFKVALKNIFSKADGSRSISLITFLGFYLLFLLNFSGNQLLDWFGKVNELKNNTDYLRRFEISVLYPPGLSEEVRDAMGRVTAGDVRGWITKNIADILKTVSKESAAGEYPPPEEILCSEKFPALTCRFDRRGNLDLRPMIDASRPDWLDFLTAYHAYIEQLVMNRRSDLDKSIKNLKQSSDKITEALRLSELLKDIGQMDADTQLAQVYPRYQTGHEFLTKEGRTSGLTTTVRWLDYKDPYLNDSRLHFLTHPQFRFTSNDDKGIVIDKETLVDELGYALDTPEVSIRYRGGQKTCIPVRAVVERMIEVGKYHVITPLGFGERIRSENHHCEPNRRFFQLRAVFAKPASKDPVEQLSVYDAYGNSKIECYPVDAKTFEIVVPEKKDAKTRQQWRRWIATTIGLPESAVHISVQDDWEYFDNKLEPPPMTQGRVDAVNKNVVRALGYYMGTYYQHDRDNKWNVNVYDYEDKIKYAHQSETIMTAIEKLSIVMLGALFLLFLSTNMIINLRNKITEIAIFRAMGGGIASIMLIFNTQVLLLVTSAVSAAILTVYAIIPQGRRMFIENVVNTIWKTLEEQRNAVAILTADDRLMNLLWLNFPVIVKSCICVLFIVCTMLLYVRFYSNFTISKVLKER